MLRSKSPLPRPASLNGRNSISAMAEGDEHEVMRREGDNQTRSRGSLTVERFRRRLPLDDKLRWFDRQLRKSTGE